ncbi:PA domain-containing protein [Caenispirillum salinarum]|uniref:PA domain-containing protein n=1 Tax=Caenispirillum salinarum TaxID=859058 RepID=UPI00384EA70C
MSRIGTTIAAALLLAPLAGIGLGTSEARGAAILQQVAPTAESYVPGTDFLAFAEIPPADLTASLQAVDAGTADAISGSSGCEASDFAGFTPGNIALMARGACLFDTKVDNAAAAGAVGALIFNDGITADRFAPFLATCGGPCSLTTFVLSYDLGTTLLALLEQQNVTMRMAFSPVPVPEPGTAALMVAGLALAGAAAARRGRRPADR